MYVRVVIISVLIYLTLDKFCSSERIARYKLATTPERESLCGTSEPNKTINDLAWHIQCVAECSPKGFDCSQHTPLSICVAVNYWPASKVCEHFYYEPTKAVNPGCELYQVAFYYLRSK